MATQFPKYSLVVSYPGFGAQVAEIDFHESVARKRFEGYKDHPYRVYVRLATGYQEWAVIVDNGKPAA